jgi:hypothetical protein
MEEEEPRSNQKMVPMVPTEGVEDRKPAFVVVRKPAS